MSMIVLDSLQTVAARGYRLQPYCRCGHYAVLDLDAAMRRFGAGLDPVTGRETIMASLKCASCGSRPIDLLLLPPKQWGGAR